MVKLGRPFKGLVTEKGRECTKCGAFKEWKFFPQNKIQLPSACLECCKRPAVVNPEKEESKQLRKQYRLEYFSWQAMKQRCLNSKDRAFKHYGGRGIKICEALLKFENFIRLLGKRPEGFTLDRIENDKHYSCGDCSYCKNRNWTLNVRWASWSIQANNRRFKSFVTTLERTNSIAN